MNKKGCCEKFWNTLCCCFVKKELKNKVNQMEVMRGGRTPDVDSRRLPSFRGAAVFSSLSLELERPSPFRAITPKSRDIEIPEERDFSPLRAMTSSSELHSPCLKEPQNKPFSDLLMQFHGDETDKWELLSDRVMKMIEGLPASDGKYFIHECIMRTFFIRDNWRESCKEKDSSLEKLDHFLDFYSFSPYIKDTAALLLRMAIGPANIRDNSPKQTRGI